MPITEATIARTKLCPELLPDCQVTQFVAINTELAILNLRRITPGRVLVLDEVGLLTNAAVELRTRADDRRIITDVGAVVNLNPPSPFHTWATKGLDAILFSTAIIANYTSYLSLWAVKPTVADKLKLKMALTPDEEKIARDLGIRDTVEKGLLPFPLSYVVEREYDILSQETISDIFNLAAGAAATQALTILPNAGEFLVLTRLSCGTPAAPTVTCTIDRDRDAAYLTFNTFPMAIAWDINCFVPALDELIIWLASTAPSAAYPIRATVLRCRMTNIIRARFGLVTRDEIPGDVWDKVMGGVV